MLHLVFQSPIETAILERSDSGDVIVFLENSVLRILQKGALSDSLSRQLTTNRLCVLSDDISVRGIMAEELVKGIEVIDYAELVDLTIKNTVIQSWC
ncbi:Sulfur relay protein TusB/DsrH [Candidatus Methylobacter favarea]|uniref:Sulfur relay protein TusB/DsrH n=1 Tax=Candidatus Methylobacter favarea TaxID=2707345 RepID=A0A8S0XHQ0_9GAMM|nr:sulfurtransferase complex subunit TusB [Candidatus Methylobacter favarea]CAA9889923.1 Sulfur relay protein TusB/DsrH [Candidatus Methylobacter favarea]